MAGQRDKYFDWDEYFRGVAIMSKARSKDPSTQVGAVVVNSDNEVLSMGYNGAPKGWSDHRFPWAREAESEYDTKYPYVCHAELNAISNGIRTGKTMAGSKIYVTLFPCNECAKLICQTGISEVVYLCDKYANTLGVKESKRMFDECGIKYRQLEVNYGIYIDANGEMYVVEPEKCDNVKKLVLNKKDEEE